MKQSDLLDAIADTLEAESRRDEGSLTPAAPSPPRRILLAEDGLVNQRVAVELLTLRGHSVVVAENGIEVMEALERESFDLILMDVQMPEMDGFEATAAIRAREIETGEHIPIVAMTAHAMKSRALSGGGDGRVYPQADPGSSCLRDGRHDHRRSAHRATGCRRCRRRRQHPTTRR